MSRRYVNVSLILLIMPLLIVWRLFVIQIQNAEQYQKESKFTRASSLPAPRGSILTEKGTVLAVDRPVWDLNLHFNDYDTYIKAAQYNIHFLLESIIQVYCQFRIHQIIFVSSEYQSNYL